MSKEISLQLNFKDRNCDDESFVKKQLECIEHWAKKKNLKVQSQKVREGSVIIDVVLTTLDDPIVWKAVGIGTLGLVGFVVKAVAQDIITQYWRKIMQQRGISNITPDNNDSEDLSQITEKVRVIDRLPNGLQMNKDELERLQLPVAWKTLKDYENVQLSMRVDDGNNNMNLDMEKSEDIFKLNVNINIEEKLKK